MLGLLFQATNVRNILCILAKEADSFLDIIAPMTKAHMNNILKQEHMTESRLFPNLPFTNIHILSEFTCCMNPRANMDQNSLAVAFFLSNTSLPNATNYLCFPILGKKSAFNLAKQLFSNLIIQHSACQHQTKKLAST